MRLMRLAISMALALMTAAAPIAAFAHAGLVSSTPAADVELATPPDEVALVFGGELSPDGTGFTVTDADGTVVGEGELDLTVADRNEVRGAVRIREPGTYTVEWTSVAADGHQETGDYAFTFAMHAPDTAARPADDVPPLGPILLVIAVAIGLRRARKIAAS